MENLNKKRIVLSGIRATGKMHLGNYLGAIKKFVALGNDPNNNCFYFIANYHTLTTRIDPESLKHDLTEIVLDYLSAGLDPNKVTIYAQSSIPETTELTWLLSCLTPVNTIANMPHFKEKKVQLEGKGQSDNVGLLTYPVLMVADILGPRANLVPVGQDQHPHVELARVLARRFNKLFGNTFPIPDLLEGEGIRVPGLNKTGKMGKSEDNGTIFLSDSSDFVKKKILTASTDTKRVHRYDPGNPTVCNIFTFHQLLSTADELTYVNQGCRNAGIGCKDCKEIVIRHVNELLQPLQERHAFFAAKGPKFINDILHEGGLRARKRISETVAIAKENVGVPNY